MVGQRGFCHIGAGRGFGTGHASILFEHAFDDAQAHRVSQRAEHAGKGYIFSGWVNKLNHKDHYTPSLDMVQ